MSAKEGKGTTTQKLAQETPQTPLVLKNGDKVDVKLATMLVGFRDIVAERLGYMLGRISHQADLNKATKAERESVTKINKEISENLETYIKEGNIDTYLAKRKELKTAREVVSKKAKPYREKIQPLNKAIKYIDTVVVPDSLKQLGATIQPRFNLSNWVVDALKVEKERKKEK